MSEAHPLDNLSRAKTTTTLRAPTALLERRRARLEFMVTICVGQSPRWQKRTIVRAAQAGVVTPEQAEGLIETLGLRGA